MTKPIVICHMLSALDGKISGDFFHSSLTSNASTEYGEIRNEYAADAWLFGTTTTKEFANFKKPDLENHKMNNAFAEDFIAEHDAKLYFISVDTKGEIWWDSGCFKKKGRPDSHIIEVLLENTSSLYKSYLREKGVSYILAGHNQLDCKLALDELNQLFGIQKVLLCGGGLINWTFVSQGVVDELSLVLAPVIDGSSETPTLFERGIKLDTDGIDTSLIEFSLKSIRILQNSSIWLNYSIKN